MNNKPEQTIEFIIIFFKHFDPDAEICSSPLPGEIVDFESDVKYHYLAGIIKVIRLFDILFEGDNQQSFINLITSFDELHFDHQSPYECSGRIPKMSWLMGGRFKFIGISLKAWLIVIIKMIRNNIFKPGVQPFLSSVKVYAKSTNYMNMPNANHHELIKSDIFKSIKYILILDCLVIDYFVEEFGYSFPD